MKVDIISSAFNCDNFLEGFFIDTTSQTFFDHCNLILVAPNPSDKLKRIYNLYKSRFNNINLMRQTLMDTKNNFDINDGNQLIQSKSKS